MAKTFTLAQVQEHNSPESLWIIVDGQIFDVSNFQNIHPGGAKILQKVGGKDASIQFWKYHNEGIFHRANLDYKIGQVQDEKQKLEEDKQPIKPEGKAPKILPYSEPAWILGFSSPYYSESHRKLQREVRKFVDEQIIPYSHDWNENYNVPSELYMELAKRGYLAGLTGFKYETEYNKYNCKSVRPEEWDQFHELILVDELSRCGSGGVMWNLIGGYCIALPPLLKHGNEYLKKRVVPDVINGQARICLCITEAEVGSDVANLTTTAKKTPDGKHYIVNGLKKWITNGIFCEYFTVAVRTGGPGIKGVSLLLIERKFGGVETLQMKCQGVWASGTSLVTFENVKVPVENLIGKENSGFNAIVTNFNHERLGMVIQASRFARICYEDALRYSFKRKTFGKRLIDHDAIKMKFGQMAGKIECLHAVIEQIVFQTKELGEAEAMAVLGGPVAFLKAQAMQTLQFCVHEASQIFGGLSYTRGGTAERVERIYRDLKAYMIAGGSEEIMLMLSMKQGISLAEHLSKL